MVDTQCWLHDSIIHFEQIKSAIIEKLPLIETVWNSNEFWHFHKSLCHNKVNPLTPKHRETHECVVSTVATDALVLKHQVISIHNAD